MVDKVENPSHCNQIACNVSKVNGYSCLIFSGSLSCNQVSQLQMHFMFLCHLENTDTSESRSWCLGSQKSQSCHRYATVVKYE